MSGAPVALLALARHLAPLRRRRPLRHPRHQLQPGHVPAPAGGRPARRRRGARSSCTRATRSARTRSSSPCNKGLGIGLVQGFTGLTIAVAVLASLTALTAFRDQPPLLRIPAALVVGLTYMVASYFAQGAFKETMQALFVLAFVLALREASRQPRLARAPPPLRPRGPARRRLRLHLQLPGPHLADRRRGHLGGHRSTRQPVPHLCGWRGCGGAENGGAAPARRPPRSRDGPRSLARRPLGVPPLRRPDRPRDRPDDRLPQLRDLRPQRPRPRQPLRPDLALRGARHLALGRLPPLARATAPCRPSATTSAPPSPRSCSSTGLSSAGAGASRRSSPASPPRRSPTPRRGSAARPTPPPRRSRSAAPLAALVIVLPLLRRPVAWLYLLAAGGCSLLALANAPVGPTSYSPGPDRPARRRSAKARPWSSPRASCSTTNTAPPTSPGSCAAVASASRPPTKRWATGRPGVRFVVTEATRRSTAVPGPAA